MLRLEYIALCLLIVGTLIGITFPIRLEHPSLFLIAEMVSVLVLLWLARLWFYFHAPFKAFNDALNSLKHNDFQNRLIESSHPVVKKLVAVYNVLMERLHQERTHQQEQNFFLEQIIFNSPNGIIVSDYDGNLLQANPSALQMLEVDLEQLKGTVLVNSENIFLQKLAEIPLNQEVEINLSAGRRYRCQKTSFIFKGFAQHLFLIQDSFMLDMKKEKQAYSKVIRMMSHEVNNTVGAVNSYLDTLKYFAPEDTESKADYLEALDVVQDRNKAMAEFMKAFASVVKVPEAELVETDLRMVLDDVLFLYESKLKEVGISIEKAYQENQIPVQADKVLLGQVFINILKNAQEAIIENQTATQKEIKICWDRATQTLSLWNSGKSIPKEIEEQLFTPFYSSKVTGQGIGLALCRDILMKHHWDHKLYSPTEGGAIFEIRIK